MRRLLFLAVVVLAAIFATSCSVEQPTAPAPPANLLTDPTDPEQITAEILKLSGWELEETVALPALDPDKILGLIVDYQREEIVDRIVHYRWDIRAGLDPQDVITLHRVVKESGPGRPIRTRKAVFLQHGDAKDFQGMFLPGTLSATTPVDFGAAVYWALRDVDVWGIDQAWNNVPAETADFGFMADWGIDKQYRDLGRAVAVARLARMFTGNGYDRMNLLGYSSGSGTGYALVNAETQLPAGLRQVGGWISVDYSPITDDPEWTTVANCDYIASLEADMAAGNYGYFVGFDFLGILAQEDPDGESPVFEGFTNLQAALYLGAGQIFGVGDIHYLAGVWEEELPVDLVHTTVPRWLDFMAAGAPWQPVKFLLDYSVWGCREQDVPWDDHFAEISVPVLNIGAAGGIGPITHWCLGLLGSSDITDLTVQLLPDDQALYDFGHIDLFIGDQAPELVWQPILAWIEGHTPNPGHHGGEAHRH